MKGAIFAVALGAIVAVSASEEKKPELTAEDLTALFSEEGANINWASLSPEALGMHLKFDEMSAAELKKVVDAFLRLGLISPEESESFASSLTDPRMRDMIQTVSENWPETMQNIIRDPKYLQFLQTFQNNIDEQALSDIVGLREGLKGALKSSEAE